MLQKGETLFAEGKLDEAEACFRAVLRDDPVNKDACNNLGVIAFQQKRTEMAAGYFLKAIQIDPSDSDALSNLAELLRVSGDLTEIVPLLETLAEKYPDNSEMQDLLTGAQLDGSTAMPENAAGLYDSLKKQQGAHEKGKNAATGKETDSDVLAEAEQLASSDRNTDAARVAWPTLERAFASGQIEQRHVDLLQRIESGLSDAEKTQLCEAALDSERIGLQNLIPWFVAVLTVITDQLAEKIGVWMSGSDIPRRVLDLLEEGICAKCRNDEIVRRVARREAALEPDRHVSVQDLYPRRLLNEVPDDDPFMKLVPEGAPSKKDGLRILVISDFNIAGQLTRLMRSLNRYTNHMARCVIFNDDYLSYDHDIVVTDRDGKTSQAALDEVRELARGADFFHIGRQLMAVDGIDWNKYLSPRNTVFQYFGSLLRDNGQRIARFHEQTGFQAITCVDWTMYNKLPNSYYDLQPYLLDIDEMPKADMDLSGSIRICHAPSNQTYRDWKRTDIIEETIARLHEDNPRVEPVIIQGMKNEECLKLKASCHVHFVSLWQSFGTNTVESAAMGLVPVLQLANFSRFVLHDSPVVHVTKETAYDTMKMLLADETRLRELGEECRQWARRQFDAKTLVQKYWYLYDLIYHGLSVDYPEIFES